MGPDGDGRQIVDPDVLADPGVLTNGEIPRELHSDSGFDVGAFAYVGAEETEHGTFQARDRQQV